MEFKLIKDTTTIKPHYSIEFEKLIGICRNKAF